MDKEYVLGFTGKELTVVFNVLTKSKYSIGDAYLVRPIVEKISPMVIEAADMDVKEEMKKEDAKEGIVLSSTEKIN